MAQGARPLLDVNCDLGESPEMVFGGAQEAILPFIHRANVACGGHEGDVETMTITVEQCLRHGVLVGAHPSYPDREGFGRRSLELAPAVLVEVVRAQVKALDEIVRAHGGALAHIKPHGALYHDVGERAETARAFLDATAAWDVPLVLLAGAATTALVTSAGRRVLAEAFADRAYEPDGSLRPRSLPGSIVDDPDAAAAQAERLVRQGRADTLCVHGDTPSALAIARALHARLGRTLATSENVTEP